MVGHFRWSPFPDANLIGSYIENVIQEREVDQHFELLQRT